MCQRQLFSIFFLFFFYLIFFCLLHAISNTYVHAVCVTHIICDIYRVSMSSPVIHQRLSSSKLRHHPLHSLHLRVVFAHETFISFPLVLRFLIYINFFFFSRRHGVKKKKKRERKFKKNHQNNHQNVAT
jgi:hypothetical protein